MMQLIAVGLACYETEWGLFILPYYILSNDTFCLPPSITR
jgi:hypothetical protein